MTLTIKFIQDIVKVHPCTKYWVRRSNGPVVRALADRHTHTHRRKDRRPGPILLPRPLTREVKKDIPPQQYCFLLFPTLRVPLHYLLTPPAVRAQIRLYDCQNEENTRNDPPMPIAFRKKLPPDRNTLKIATALSPQKPLPSRTHPPPPQIPHLICRPPR